jgi:5'-3' exonuclease
VEFFRCFHGAPRATVEGREVGAVRGLLQTLAALLRNDDLTHVALAFDPMAPDPAHPLLSQVTLAIRAVRALGITVWPLYRAEADDGLATAASRWADDVARVVLCTTDRDLLQCVRGTRVVVRNRIRKETHAEADVRARFGVAPEQLPAFFALVGMPKKGMPGVEGWGAKATSAVLREYGTLDEIPRDGGDWTVQVRGRDRLAANLTAHLMEARLYRNLITLRRDLPLPHQLRDLRWRTPAWPDLEELCAEIGDESVLDRLPESRA